MQMEDAQYTSNEQQLDVDGVRDSYSSERALAPITIRLGKSTNRPHDGSQRRIPTAAATETTTIPSKAAAVPPAPLPLPSLHLLPCRIAHTGAAAVGAYFQPAPSTTKGLQLNYGNGVDALTESKALDQWECSFRGRQITGSVVSLPPHAHGFVFEEDDNTAIHIDQDEDGHEEKDAAQQHQQQHAWKTATTFSSLFLWQPDQEFFDRKHIRESIEEWIPIAHAIHDPLP